MDSFIFEIPAIQLPWTFFTSLSVFYWRENVIFLSLRSGFIYLFIWLNCFPCFFCFFLEHSSKVGENIPSSLCCFPALTVLSKHEPHWGVINWQKVKPPETEYFSGFKFLPEKNTVDPAPLSHNTTDVTLIRFGRRGRYLTHVLHSFKISLLN